MFIILLSFVLAVISYSEAYALCRMANEFLCIPTLPVRYAVEAIVASLAMTVSGTVFLVAAAVFLCREVIRA